MNGVTKLDLTSDTVTPATLVLGATAHDKSGTPIIGTYEGSSLNFSVKQYPAATDLSGITGGENEIALLTDTDVSSWQFSYAIPSSPIENMVWIKLADTAHATFNMLVDNSIVIAGATAQQYISGIWVPIEAKIYQNGSWNDFRKYLFREGIGPIVAWKGYGSGSGTNASITTDSMVTNNTGSASNGSRPGLVTFGTFDFSPYTTLYLDFMLQGAASGSYKFGITFTRNNTNKQTDIYSATQGYTPSGAIQNRQYTIGTAPVIRNTRVTLALTIDSTVKSSPCYLGFAYYVGTPSFTIYNVWLE